MCLSKPRHNPRPKAADFQLQDRSRPHSDPSPSLNGGFASCPARKKCAARSRLPGKLSRESSTNPPPMRSSPDDLAFMKFNNTFRLDRRAERPR